MSSSSCRRYAAFVEEEGKNERTKSNTLPARVEVDRTFPSLPTKPTPSQTEEEEERRRKQQLLLPKCATQLQATQRGETNPPTGTPNLHYAFQQRKAGEGYNGH